MQKRRTWKGMIFLVAMLICLGRTYTTWATERTAKEVANEIGVGWNLGNQFECYASNPSATITETFWGSPKVTKQLIDQIAEEGFGAVRIPVTYYNHMNADHVIDQKWLERVSEVVDNVLEDQMYCVIDLHHDTGQGGWLTAEQADLPKNQKALEKIWKQIATYFRDYDDRLIFESYNEILNKACKWDWAGSESYETANALNQAFVDIVRATGGKNASRVLCVPTYAASSSDHVIAGFQLPKDTVKDRLLVDIHCYNSGDVTKVFENINARLCAKNIPVMIGEFGAVNKNQKKEREDYIAAYLANAKKYAIPCFWWDDGQTCEKAENVYNYALINRRTLKWYFKDLADLMVNSSEVHKKAIDKNISGTQADYASIANCDLSDFTNWRSGWYDNGKGQYGSYEKRICLKDYKKVEPGCTYEIQSGNANIHVLIREMNADLNMIKSYDLVDGKTYTASESARYIAVVLYNCGQENIMSYHAFQDLFENGYTAAIIEEKKEQAPVEGKQEISECELSEFSNWRTGWYNNGDGKYGVYNERICLKDYKSVGAGVTYQVRISNADYRLVIREMDSDYKMVKSIILNNESKYVPSVNAKYIAVVMYNAVRPSEMNYEGYHKLFNDGMKVSISDKESDQIIPDQSQSVEKPQEKTSDLLACNLADFSNWRTGWYDNSRGKYGSYPERICLNDYKEIDTTMKYKIGSSDSRYHILIRELTSDYSFIKSHNLTDGSEFIPDKNTKYVAVTIYTSQEEMTYDKYQTLFANGYIPSIKNSLESVPKEPQIPEEPETPKVDNKNILACDLSDFNNWRTGWYDNSRGRYGSYPERICLNDYKEIDTTIKYKIASSDSRYHILIRELASDQNFIKSNDFTDGCVFVPDKNTRYIAVTIYTSKEKMTYDKYKSLFANGYVPGIKVCTNEAGDSAGGNTAGTGNNGGSNGGDDLLEPELPGSGAPVEDTSIEAFQAEIRNMYLTGDMTTHNIAKYKLTYIQMNNAWNALRERDEEVAFAEACYASAFLKPTKDEKGICQTVYLYNADKDFPMRYKRAKEAVNEVVGFIKNNPKMTDLDKVMYVHDYIIEHATYRKTGNLDQYSMGYLLGANYGVCEAYAESMMYLLKKVGVDTTKAHSKDMNHVWNYVKIDGIWYQVDATWDERDNETSSGIQRTYLVRNDDEFKNKLPRKHYNWQFYSDKPASSDSTKYVNWFVHNINVHMYYIDGYWYYQSGNKVMKVKADGSVISTYIDANSEVKIKKVEGTVIKYSVAGVDKEIDVKQVEIGEESTPLTGNIQDEKAGYLLEMLLLCVLLCALIKKKVIRIQK